MNNWRPKPLRPEPVNPLFKENTEYRVVKSQELTPIQRQRLADGTQHTRTGRTALRPPYIPIPEDSPELYLNKSENVQPVEKSLDPDDVVKSFLKGMTYDDEKDEEARKAGFGAKLADAAVGAAKVATNVAGKVGRTAAGLAQTK